MAYRSAIRKIRAQVRRMSRRLVETGADPSNADRALLAAWVVANFVSVTSGVKEIDRDLETAISDLLADLMHWCDFQGPIGHAQEPIGFNTALERARDYYREERGDELEQDFGIPE
jgi:hypothetical protein